MGCNATRSFLRIKVRPVHAKRGCTATTGPTHDRVVINCDPTDWSEGQRKRFFAAKLAACAFIKRLRLAERVPEADQVSPGPVLLICGFAHLDVFPYALQNASSTNAVCKGPGQPLTNPGSNAIRVVEPAECSICLTSIWNRLPSPKLEQAVFRRGEDHPSRDFNVSVFNIFPGH